MKANPAVLLAAGGTILTAVGIVVTVVVAGPGPPEGGTDRAEDTRGEVRPPPANEPEQPAKGELLRVRVLGPDGQGVSALLKSTHLPADNERWTDRCGEAYVPRYWIHHLVEVWVSGANGLRLATKRSLQPDPDGTVTIRIPGQLP